MGARSRGLDMSRLCSSAGYENFTRGLSQGMRTFGSTLTHEGILSAYDIQFDESSGAEADRSRGLGDPLVCPLSPVVTSSFPSPHLMRVTAGLSMQVTRTPCTCPPPPSPLRAVTVPALPLKVMAFYQPLPLKRRRIPI